MNKRERKTMVLCMEFIARNLNDEEDLFRWFMNGVADGDFNYNSIVEDFNVTLEDVDEYYIEDKTFADLMNVFIRTMRNAARPNYGGGLWCDGVLDKAED